MKITVQKNDKEVSIEVRKPVNDDKVGARGFVAQKFKELIQEDILTRDQLNQALIKKGLWSTEQEEKLKTLTKKIFEGERQLARGGKDAKGKKFSKEKAKQLAIEMRVSRLEQMLLLISLKKYDNMTLEGKLDDVEFDYLVSKCCFYDNGKPVFKDYNDYIENSTEEYAVKCAQELSNLLYGEMSDTEKNNPENKFLLQYGFVDEELRLINKDGDLVDSDGKRVDEEGRYIDKDGQYIDSNGNRVDELGNPFEEFVPFDDD